MVTIKQSTLIQKGGNVENHFIVTGNDLADVVATALSKIREKSRNAYAEDMQDKLARGKDVFIDKHSGSGTYYTVIWESPIYVGKIYPIQNGLFAHVSQYSTGEIYGKKYGEPFFSADMLNREGRVCYNFQGSGFCITYTASGDTNEEFKIIGESIN